MSRDVRKIIESLKERVEKGQTFVQEECGDSFEVSFIWYDPASQAEIENFIETTGWTLPDSYQSFLRMHNGSALFSHEVGSFVLHPIKELLKYYKEYQEETPKTFPPNWYHIGTYFGNGEYLYIDSDKVKQGREDYLIFIGVGIVIEVPMNFETWLDRFIICQGNRF